MDNLIIDLMKSLKRFVCKGKVSQEEIENAEKLLNLKFANEYKSYVSEFGTASAVGIELTGITPSPRLSVVEVTKRERELNENFPANMYVVEDPVLEGLMILQDESGAIYSILPHGTPKKIFNSLYDYIKENGEFD